MSPQHLCVAGMLRLVARLSPSRRVRPPARRPVRLRPSPEGLEPRLPLDGSVTTYTWTALGDGTSFSDPNNWSHVGPLGGGVGVPGTPSPGSNLAFPPIALLPANSPTTINFNGTNGTLPFNLLEISDSYTLTGNAVALSGGIVVTNPYFGSPTDATIFISNVILGRQATVYTQQGTTLNLGEAANTTGVQLVLQGSATKTGAGQLVIDTSSITAPLDQGSLQTFEIAGGTVTLDTSMDFSDTLFAVDPGADLEIADDAAVNVGSLSGSGTVDLQGTGAAGDSTALTASTPLDESDNFAGSIVGDGQLSMQGPGSLTVGGIDFGNAGAVDVTQGTLDVDGPITAGTLQVSGATFGGLGSWHFSGPVTFQSGSTFDVALDGLTAGTQSTQLVSADSTTGITLGGSTLAGSVDYEYQAGDEFTIASAPLVSGVFGNVVNGQVLLGGVPFSVTYSGTSVTLTAQQSETTTQLTTSGTPSHPGQAVTFTASVSTRTMPVTGGTVSFEQGGTVLATVPVTAGGTASYTTTSLPLGGTTITASFNGAGNILGSTSAAVTQDVVPYTTATVVTSSMNPILFRQAVTLIATVTADGMPVTSGTVTFTRGGTVIGVAALGPDGTARLTTSSLPRKNVRIQASFGGTPDDDGSVSPVYVQAVNRAPTATTLTTATALVRGKGRQLLVATVEAVGLTGINPAGTVAFLRGGRVIGRAGLVDGTATLVLPRRTHGRGRFVAKFQGNPRFGASTSALLVLPA